MQAAKAGWTQDNMEKAKEGENCQTELVFWQQGVGPYYVPQYCTFVLVEPFLALRAG